MGTLWYFCLSALADRKKCHKVVGGMVGEGRYFHELSKGKLFIEREIGAFQQTLSKIHIIEGKYLIFILI